MISWICKMVRKMQSSEKCLDCEHSASWLQKIKFSGLDMLNINGSSIVQW